MGSFDLVRLFKRHFPDDPHRLGHFGTLDPFASGVLLVGVGGAARLNDFVHAHLPKTYLAVGRLGIQTDTADWQGEIKQTDFSPYSQQVISQFDLHFIKERLAIFQGDYWQAPPAFSATKFEGKPLHEWARQGVEIKKEPVKRFIHSFEVVKYQYPFLCFRATVSSGTYIRTLFEDIARELGTIGRLSALVRESIGSLTMESSLRPHALNTDFSAMALKPEEVIPFPVLELPDIRKRAFLNGLSSRLSQSVSGEYAWMMSGGENWGLVQRRSDEWKTVINFEALKQAQSTHC
jgi:tRNA pseudouridine55 synthase